MKQDFLTRSGEPADHLDALSPIEASAVIYWRLWAQGEQGRRRVHADFDTALGAHAGSDAVGALSQIFDICARHCRRPLTHCALGCKCLGADERCFADFIGYASECNREDAALVASLLVNPNLCLLLATHAQTFGLALRRMACAPPLTRTNSGVKRTAPKSRTIH